MTLLVAGQETSAVLLAWATAFLAHVPQVQAHAAAEVAQVLAGQAPNSSNIRCGMLTSAPMHACKRTRCPCIWNSTGPGQ